MMVVASAGLAAEITISIAMGKLQYHSLSRKVFGSGRVVTE